MATHRDDPPCPFCGTRQRYEDARPSKPLVSAPYMAYEHGRMRQRRDTYWNTHCVSCGERIIWTMTLAPVAGIKGWSKPS